MTTSYQSSRKDNGERHPTKHSSFSSEDTVSFSNFKVSFLDRKVPLLLFIVVVLFIALVAVSSYTIFISLTSQGLVLTRKSTDVETSCGIVRGVKHKGILQYLGIPYALPPTGDRRFRKPVELSTKELCAQAWNTSATIHDKILDASKFRSLCMQVTPISNALVGEEDCLYLNIFAPATHNPNVLHPVIFITGGFFFNYGGASNGSAFAHQPDPDTVLSMDAIQVTINYRLGPLGFLTHPSTNETNLGVRDQIAGFRWIRNNVRAFGGDPLKISMFSYGTGATTSLALFGSPLAQHTFDKAWISAPALQAPTITPLAAFEAAKKVFDCDGCPSTSEEIVRLWDWNIVEPWIEHMFSLPLPSNRACLPGVPCEGGLLVVDGELISSDFWGSPMFPIPIVIGQNSHEVAAYTSPNTVRLWTPDAMIKYMHQMFGQSSPQFKLLESYYKLNELHKPEKPKNGTDHISRVEDKYLQIVTDVRVTCPLQSYANTMRRVQPIHRYLIRSQLAPFNPYNLDSFVNAAFHGWDAFLFFKTYRYHPDYLYATNNAASEEVEKLSENFCKAVKNFIWHDNLFPGQEDIALTVFENNVVYSSAVDELSMCNEWNKLLEKNPFIYAWEA